MYHTASTKYEVINVDYNFLLNTADNLRNYLIHKIHWSNMFSELFIKKGLFGFNHWYQCRPF